jgi:hypothetical protein
MRRTTLTLIVLAAVAAFAVAAVSSASIKRGGLAITAEQPGWQKALHARSDALNREYGLGNYARKSSAAAADDNAQLQVAAGQLAAGGKVTVRISDMNAGGKGDSVTNGGVAGTGHFTASGAITDKGAAVVYRTVKDPLITLRYVTAGKKGTITFVVKINMTLGSSRWTIASGTKAYKGLHGKGIERENADYTVSTLTGTVSR